MGISEKTLRKRMAAGAVKFRRVVLARGGAAFEVEMESGLESSKSKFQTDRKKFQTDSPKGYISSDVLRSKSPGFVTGLEVEMESSKPLSKPTAEGSKPVTISSEREAELKDEIRFLRDQLLDANRNAAELRQSLREALRIAPRQLTAHDPSTSEQSARNAPQAPSTRPQPPSFERSTPRRSQFTSRLTASHRRLSFRRSNAPTTHHPQGA